MPETATARVIFAPKASRAVPPRRCKPHFFACQTEGIRKQPRGAGKTRRKALLNSELAGLWEFAKKRKATISKKEEAEMFGIYLRVVRRMQELKHLRERWNGPVKQELVRLSEAKELAERVVASRGDMRYLRELAAEKRRSLEKEEEYAVFRIYRRVLPRMMNLGKGGIAANAEHGLVAQEMERLSEAKRLAETIIIQTMEKQFWMTAKYVIHPSVIEKSDLVQEACMAVVRRAMRTFDPDQDCRISTYCQLGITRAMKRAVQNQGKTIRIPCNTYTISAKVNRAYMECRKSGYEPTAQEIADLAGLDLKKVVRCLEMPDTLSMDVRPEDRLALIDTIPDNGMDPLETLVNAEVGSVVETLLGKLRPDQRRILCMRQGLGCKEHTLKEIAEVDGCSGENIRQKLFKIARRIRNANKALLREYQGYGPDDEAPSHEPGEQASAGQR